jgi:hypothetical protein
MTNSTSEGWRYLSEISEISGNGWKVLERRTNHQWDLSMRKEIATISVQKDLAKGRRFWKYLF